jgi:Leucine-rich repeat (LRR) protein
MIGDWESGEIGSFDGTLVGKEQNQDSWGKSSSDDWVRANEKNLDTFKSLKILSLQSNRITKLEGLEGLTNLEEIYLSHNGLKKIEGLEHNVSPLFIPFIISW